MRRFRFRLQSILDLRVHEEEQCRLELGAITSRCSAIRGAIDERRVERRHVLGTRPASVRSEDVQWRVATEAYALRLESEALSLERDLLDAEQERQRAAERYRTAKQNAEVLQKLREKRARLHRDESHREEQYRLDEVSQHIYSQGGR